jgi:rod shape-determining protein MreD
MKTPIVIGVLAASLLLQSTIAGMSFAAGSRVNLVLVAVIYVALAYGAVTGMLAGCAAGLVQDSIAGGIVGIGGLSKTVVGFFVGVLGAQFIVSTPVPRFLMFFGASLVHELCFQALYALVEAHSIRLQISGALIQALVNGAVGITIFMLAERGPEMMQRDNWRRSSTVRRRY